MLIVRKTLKWLMGLVLVLILGLVLLLIACKMVVDSSSIISHQIFNPAKTCYVNIAKVNSGDESLSIPIREASIVMELTRGSVVYRVYTQDHKLIATTEWWLFSALRMFESPQWIENATLIYEGTGMTGYEQFLLPECGIKK